MNKLCQIFSNISFQKSLFPFFDKLIIFLKTPCLLGYLFYKYGVRITSDNIYWIDFLITIHHVNLTSSNNNMNFQKFIKKLIASRKLESKYTDILTDKLSLSCYKKEFTHSSCYPIHNYEVYEQLGDITVNKFLLWYFHNRFSNNLNSSFGLK